MTRIPLALLPGTLCTAVLWDNQIEALADIADIHVIETSHHDNLDALAEHIHTVMPDQFAVAGLSYGGIVAFAVWRHNPRVISHLGLMNTTSAPVTAEKRVAQMKQADLAVSGQFQAIVIEQASNLMSMAACRPNLGLHAKILTMANQVGAQGFVNQIKAQVNRPDNRPILGDITCPTLVLTGENDRFCPPDIHCEIASKIPNATLYIIPNCGHLSTFEQPEQVFNLMRIWLQS
ncbi:MAG: alpha/beta hydrolase [Chloroflexota bacterium]